MSEQVKVGELAEFPEGRGRAVRLDGKRVAVFNLGHGRLLAVQDGCPHMGASLADGRLVDGRAVVCHWHGWRFDLASGRGEPPAKRWACARTYEVELRGTEVYLRRPPEQVPTDPEADAEDWPLWDGERFVRRRRQGND